MEVFWRSRTRPWRSHHDERNYAVLTALSYLISPDIHASPEKGDLRVFCLDAVFWPSVNALDDKE